MPDNTFTSAQPAREWMAKRCPFCGSPKGQYAASTGELSAAFICKGCGINETASQPSPAATVEIHGDGYCGCTERCRDRDNCQYDVKPVPRLSAGSVSPLIWNALEQALDRLEWLEAYKAGKRNMLPQVDAAISLLKAAQKAALTLAEPQPSAGNEALAKDCELYAKVIEGITVIDDETGANERREPRATLLKAAAALRNEPQELRETLELARQFIDPDASPPRMTNREMVQKINAALALSRPHSRTGES